jgi:hypothetical protein
MELDNLKDGWQQRGAPELHWQKGADMVELRRKLENLRRASWRRDLRETIVALFVTVMFTWVALHIDGWLAQIGAAAIVAAAVFIIVWMPLAGGRNREPDRDLPVGEFFRRELRYLDRQIRLLRSVFWWYSGPNLAGLVLFFIGTGRSVTMITILVGAVLAVEVGIVWLNQVTARTALMPLRVEVAGLLRDLEADGQQ